MDTPHPYTTLLTPTSHGLLLPLFSSPFENCHITNVVTAGLHHFPSFVAFFLCFFSSSLSLACMEDKDQLSLQASIFASTLYLMPTQEQSQPRMVRDMWGRLSGQRRRGAAIVDYFLLTPFFCRSMVSLFALVFLFFL
ncbi:hypothetical protein JOL62DRAFT_233018 [Phyllosticta paracitricarpa]|uniref:Uncharacterized protein n=1 Tax=Phyllosticta paracitricarpa TaxID=2016321 RepID=A0ABR1NIX2_9PEZI